ncbi:uncharacterized protein MONBRDRAFT_34096 [Monosiga brevicollis MX1]|uniref:Protein kinase domain-containing protein n=1 Tax=Monosiga brevicollis TaxID=81824 RepID=A9V9K6_MONBE|nr:uncharacterized protein MONBRDRAFT_34096 [Monosiga brevicollis MX1]EDQ85738.1 predicted protein [Monosiga brevicollis MX1]|eukprot:XP_001749453.1 hypothetical protein [Monosiga brevicollis MX1]
MAASCISSCFTAVTLVLLMAALIPNAAAENRTAAFVVDCRNDIVLPQLADLLQLTNATTVLMYGDDSGGCCDLFGDRAWPNIHSVELRCMPHDPNMDLAALKSIDTHITLPNLLHFELINCSRLLSFPHFDAPNLQSLRLQNVDLDNVRAISNFPALREINFDTTAITHLPPLPCQVEIINVHNSPIFSLEAESFTCARPTVANLSGNSIEQIDPDCFTASNNLRVFDMSGNMLEVMALDPNNDFPVLEVFSLANNFLTLLTGAFSAGAMTYLSVAANRLTAFDSGVFSHLSKLTELDLSDNHFTSLQPHVLDPLTALERIHLENNRLTALDADVFAKLPALRNITISNNAITTLDSTIFAHNPQLQNLIIFGNSLTELAPDIFHNNPHLRYADMCDNFFTTFPAPLFQNNPNLEIFSASATNIRHLPAGLFAGLTRLQDFYVVNSLLTTLPSGLFDDTVSLRSLMLGGNMFTTLPDGLFSKLHRLSQLDIGGHRMSRVDVEALGVPNNVTLLSISSQSAEYGCIVATTQHPFRNLASFNSSGCSLEPQMLQSVLHSAPALSILQIGGPQLCALNGSTTLTLNRLPNSLSLISVANSDCQVISLGGAYIDSLFVQFNEGLTALTVNAPRAVEASINNNPQLSKINVFPVQVLDISNTALDHMPAFCTVMGTQSFSARGMQDSDLFTYGAASILRTCLTHGVSVMDFSNNVDLNNLDNVDLNYRVLISFELQPGENYWLDGMQLLRLDVVPSLSFVNSPVQCEIMPDYGTAVVVSADMSIDFAPLHYHAINCRCTSGYTNAGGLCKAVKPSFWDYKGAVAVVFIFPGLALLLIVAYLARRRLRRMYDNIELKQRLLSDTEAQVEELKRGWQIDASEIRLLERIDGDSQGAFGSVYAADWDHMRVCVKLLREGMSFDEMTEGVFDREINFLQRFRHPQLVRFFGAGHMPADGTDVPFLVLELVDRGSLAQVLLKESLTRAQKLSILLDVARGIEHLHSHGVAHRDLKSGNVLISSDFRAKVSDFGSVKRFYRKAEGNDDMSDVDASAAVHSANLQYTMSLGTPLYLSPEVLRGEAHDGFKVDVFAFGVLCYETAHQKVPDLVGQFGDFRGPFLYRLGQLLDAGHRLQLDTDACDVPVGLANLSLSCMAGPMHERPTFDVIVNALQDLDLQLLTLNPLLLPLLPYGIYINCLYYCIFFDVTSPIIACRFDSDRPPFACRVLLEMDMATATTGQMAAWPSLLGEVRTLLAAEDKLPACRPSHVCGSKDGSCLFFLFSLEQGSQQDIFRLQVNGPVPKLENLTAVLAQPAAAAQTKEEELLRERQRQYTTGVTSFVYDPAEDVIFFPFASTHALMREATTRKPTTPPHLLPSRARFDAKLCPGNSSWLAYCHDGEVWLENTDVNRLWAITDAKDQGTKKHQTAGIPSYIVQEEFSRFTGFWWAPDGSSILVELVDEGHVRQVHVTDQMFPGGEDSTFVYPRAGDANALTALTLVAIDFEACLAQPDTPGLMAKATRGVMELAHPDREYLVNAGFAGSPHRIWLLTLDRAQRHLRLELTSKTALLHDEGRETEVMLEVTHRSWVNTYTTIGFVAEDLLKPAAGSQGSRIVGYWITDRSGFDHIELFERTDSGTQVVPVTSGKWPVLDSASVQLDMATGRFCFFARKDTPLQAHMYMTAVPAHWQAFVAGEHSLASVSYAADFQRLSPEAQLKQALVTLESSHQAPQLALLVLESGSYTMLQSTEMSALHLRPRFFPIVMPNGCTYHSMVLSATQSSDQPRPVVLYVYGGPHVQLVQDVPIRRRAALFQAFLNRGFNVVMIDVHGSTGRGRLFEEPLNRRMGTFEIDHQIKALQTLHSQHPELGLDLSRVGVHGWSYGGYASLIALATRPDFFKVAVAGAPVTLWEAYDTGYTERYMGQPKDEPEAYRRGSVLEMANGFPDEYGRLLIMHGLSDENVHFSHTATLIDRLHELGKPYELQVYPRARHGVRTPHERIHHTAAIVRYIAKGL